MRSVVGALLNRAPVKLTSAPRLSMLPSSRDDKTDALKSMTSTGTLFAIVDRLANSTSQVDWGLFRAAASGKDEDRTPVARHAALDLWTKPNPYAWRQEFTEATQQHLELAGEGWWVIARAPGFDIPLELWVVRPDRIAPVIGTDGSTIVGYRYGSGTDAVPLATDEVISMRRPHPLEAFRGLGAVQSIYAELDAYRYSLEWNRTFFRNSAEPGGVIEMEQNLSDDEFAQWRQRWQEQHQGVSNAHRVAILEGGATWKPNQMTFRDMQFTELREVARDTIREAFGMPKAMLGAADDVNRANAEAGEWVFSRWLLVPRLERLKGALNHQLLPMFGTAAAGLEFDYTNPVPPNQGEEVEQLGILADAAKTLVDAGFEPTEVLAALGLPAMSHTPPPEPEPPMLPPGPPPGPEPEEDEDA